MAAAGTAVAAVVGTGAVGEMGSGGLRLSPLCLASGGESGVSSAGASSGKGSFSSTFGFPSPSGLPHSRSRKGSRPDPQTWTPDPLTVHPSRHSAPPPP